MKGKHFKVCFSSKCIFELNYYVGPRYTLSYIDRAREHNDYHEIAIGFVCSSWTTHIPVYWCKNVLCDLYTRSLSHTGSATHARALAVTSPVLWSKYSSSIRL